MRLFFVEWKKLIHQKLFYVISFLLLLYGLFLLSQMIHGNRLVGDHQVLYWESRAKIAETFIPLYKNSDESSLDESQKQQLQHYQSELELCNQMLDEIKQGNWRAGVSEQWKAAKEDLNGMESAGSFYGEDALRQVRFQVASYEYLLEQNIPIWQNMNEINGWNTINVIMQTIVPWVAFGIGILGSISISQEKKSISFLFVSPYRKGTILIIKTFVLVAAGIFFLFISVGIPAILAAFQNGMGNYRYPIQVGQQALQIAEQKELAPLFVCVLVMLMNAIIFFTFVVSFSVFCSTCFMHSVPAFLLTESTLCFGSIVPSLPFYNYTIPIFGYGNNISLLNGKWNIFSGIFLISLGILLFTSLSIFIIRRKDL